MALEQPVKAGVTGTPKDNLSLSLWQRRKYFEHIFSLMLLKQVSTNSPKI
jgi:hypothetical protein